MITEHQRRVASFVLAIPRGEVRTYGELAEAVGGTAKSARGMAQALKALGSSAVQVPWWRVVHSDGSIASPDQTTMDYARRMLLEEGQHFTSDGRVAGVSRRVSKPIVIRRPEDYCPRHPETLKGGGGYCADCGY